MIHLIYATAEELLREEFPIDIGGKDLDTAVFAAIRERFGEPDIDGGALFVLSITGQPGNMVPVHVAGRIVAYAVRAA